MTAQVESLGAEATLSLLAESLNVPLSQDGGLSPELVAGVMRRLCASLCPCPARSIVATTTRSLRFFSQDEAALQAAVEEVLEDLLTSGDVVELARVTLPGAEDKPTWLFPASPSFVARGKRIYFFGMGPDDAPFLPEEFGQRVRCEGAARYLEAGQVEGDAVSELRSLGLREVAVAQWLQGEREETAQTHVAWLQGQLKEHGESGPLTDMKVLAHRTDQSPGYRSRWHPETGESGLHIVRVERLRGAPLWYAADLVGGQCVRSVLLPLRNSRLRACDQAWRAQLAIDAAAEHPATFRAVRAGDGERLVFDFPLPLAARRRLSYLGSTVMQSDNPYSFWLPDSQVAEEVKYLERHLWMRRLS